MPISWADFEKVDMRVGRVTEAQEFPEARRPAYRLWIDLGAYDEAGEVILLHPDHPVVPGSKIG